jgi:hypothetical protein
MLLSPQLLDVAVTPLNFTVLDPCVTPKPAPVIVTEVPTGPEFGDRLVIGGTSGMVTVNVVAPVACPPEVATTILPVVAALGTGAIICVLLQLVGTAVVPLNLTVLDPCVAPKFVPVIVTEVPTGPEVGVICRTDGTQEVACVNTGVQLPA